MAGHPHRILNQLTPKHIASQSLMNLDSALKPNPTWLTRAGDKSAAPSQISLQEGADARQTQHNEIILHLSLCVDREEPNRSV